MGWCAGGRRHHATALVLTAATGALVCLLFATDRRLGLQESASTRYRFHAIPVAVSELYHHRPHDYTAHRKLAMRFHDSERKIDDQIREAVDPDLANRRRDVLTGSPTTGAWPTSLIVRFHLFGPRVSSLSKLWFLILSITLHPLHDRATGGRPPRSRCRSLILFGWLGIASDRRRALAIPQRAGCWGEDIALYESRMFDGLALVAVLHLAILAGSGCRVSRAGLANGDSSGRDPRLSLPRPVVARLAISPHSSLWRDCESGCGC